VLGKGPKALKILEQFITQFKVIGLKVKLG
jgi:hypothetical protein